MSGRPSPRPVTPAALRHDLAEALARRDPGHPLRVIVDGPPPARPEVLADEVAALLPALGRPALRVRAGDFLRPASVRLEHGRDDPDALYDVAVDLPGLAREVLDPLGPGGSGRFLPTLRDAARDRATRAAYATAPPRAVLLLDGAMLAGRWLPVDVTLHLHLPPDALARGLPAWSLPAYARHEEEADPDGTADLVVLVKHPDRPAVLDRGLLSSLP